jgi:para-nitrobenzyl esterase
VFRQLREHNRPAATPEDEALSDMLRTYWTNFAGTGDPNGADLPKWPSFSDSAPQMLHIASGHTLAGPVVNEAGLRALDDYFTWRRSSADH